MCQARDELFVIDSSNGFVPNGSTVLVSQGLFVLAGQLFAASVCQSGPAPAFVAPWVYQYLLRGTEAISSSFNEDSLSCSKHEELFKKVCF